MKITSALVGALLLAATSLHAQAPGEIVFWETVRDSKNPAELRAYLQRFPNGMFAPIAEARLAALERPAAVPAPATGRAAQPAPKPPAPAVASTAPASVTSATRMPQSGDTWTYTLSYPRLRGQWGQPTRASSSYVVKVASVSEGRIVDQTSIDGGTTIDVTHSSNATLGPQGVSIFSPYLIAARDLPPRGSVGSVSILDQGCKGAQACDASAQVVGPETIDVPAGRFNAVKVLVTQTWRSSGSSSGIANVQGLMGGRTLTVWYVPELKRAIKFQSRLTVGDLPPVESNFDLDLQSYQVK